jgi:UDP-N-acetylmuramyl pentapeptide phosphotransferase/UDP-N-acetylglucosamine-1-phosphate transferase
MGDTGSLVLGFIVSVLCVKLVQINSGNTVIVPHAPIFTLSIVAIPVFDTLRVFSLRIWAGKSPFSPDKTHIHHLLTLNGWSHRFSAKLICCVHAFVLILGYLLKNVRQEWSLLLLCLTMLLTVFLFQRLKPPHRAKAVALGSAE